MTWESATAEQFIAAAKLCAVEGIYCAWSDDEREGLTLTILCNDRFAPAADGESVPPDAVQEALAAISGKGDEYEAAMGWIAGRRARSRA